MNKEVRNDLLNELKVRYNVTSELELQQFLKKHYYEGTALISDSTYDNLFKEDPIGYDLSNTIWPKFNHIVESIPMVKYKNIDSATNFLLDKSQPNIIEHKLDGINITLYYFNGELKNVVTRGSGVAGEDIYSNGIEFKGILKKLDTSKPICVIRGELVISIEDFTELEKGLYSNRRNAVAGIARRLDGEYSNKLTFYAYKYYDGESEDTLIEYKSIEARHILQTKGFIIPENLLNQNKSLGILYAENAISRDTYKPYQHDGLVIKSNEYEFALKYNANTEETEITGYTWSLGNSNKLVPVVTFKPIIIGGATLTKASVASFKNYKEIDAPIGSIVEVARANEVIPYLKSVISRASGDLEIPTKCPVCNSDLVQIGANLICENLECPHRLYSICNKIVEVLDVPQFTKGVITKLLDNGKIKSINDIFSLTIEDFKVANVREARAKAMLDSIYIRFKDFSQLEIIQCLNIPSVSLQALNDFNDILLRNNLSIVQVFSDCENFKYILNDYFKSAKTTKIIKYINDYKHVLDDLKINICKIKNIDILK